jgi:hypothetical protein
VIPLSKETGRLHFLPFSVLRKGSNLIRFTKGTRSYGKRIAESLFSVLEVFKGSICEDMCKIFFINLITVILAALTDLLMSDSLTIYFEKTLYNSVKGAFGILFIAISSPLLAFLTFTILTQRHIHIFRTNFNAGWRIRYIDFNFSNCALG